MTEKTNRQSYHHGDLVEAVLDAVEKMVEDAGAESVSLRACAKKVGVSHSALFRHFSGKRDVLTAFAIRSANHMANEIRQKVDKAAQEEKFLVAGLAYIDYAVRNSGPFRVIFREDIIEPTDTGYRNAMDKLAACLAIGGHGSGNDMAISPKALLAWASVHGIATLRVDGSLSRDVSDDRFESLVGETLRQMSLIMKQPS